MGEGGGGGTSLETSERSLPSPVAQLVEQFLFLSVGREFKVW